MANKARPISPSEISQEFPDAVIEAVNQLLKEKFRGDEVTLYQKDVIARIIKLDPSIKREELFEKKYMDFEDIFRKAGWVVEYDKPGWDENYEPYFKFRPKKGKKPKKNPFFP